MSADKSCIAIGFIGYSVVDDSITTCYVMFTDSTLSSGNAHNAIKAHIPNGIAYLIGRIVVSSVCLTKTRIRRIKYLMSLLSLRLALSFNAS